MRSIIVLFLLTFVTLHSTFCQNWDSIEIKTTAITESVYMLEGVGGNVGVVIGDEHVMLIDGMFAQLTEKIMAVVDSLTDKPVQFLLNTHWHKDHTNANPMFNARGVTLMAHDNVKTRLITGGEVPFFGTVVPPQMDDAYPELTFGSNFDLLFGSETVQIICARDAHTDGDAFVYLPGNNVLHMGDVYFSEMYPFIDLSSGGTVRGIIDACRDAISISNVNTTVIAGHGPLSDFSALVDYTLMLSDIANKVEELKYTDVELKEVIEQADSITGPYDERYGGGFISAKDLLTFVYNSL